MIVNTSNKPKREIFARVCLTLPLDLIINLDALRDDIPRSRFVRRILEDFIGGSNRCS